MRLHGWNSGHVARIMDNLIARGEAEPMIVVMPNGNFSKQAAAGETSENLDYRPVMTNMLADYKNGAYEMAFTEIIDFIDNEFLTLPDKQHRALPDCRWWFSHPVCRIELSGIFRLYRVVFGRVDDRVLTR